MPSQVLHLHGYTLCIGTISSHAINASVYARMPLTPEQASDFVAAETRRWGEVARRANIRAE